ncbi:3-deoxy-7-phosphoheptulonate synthase [Brumimicrobium aurantiacum]|uniref:3-deoxy-7-phosphoheptulonate synthase n=1 Tax=Brumimicrobium aurantiacum TaxID=1737063 RepID=A0A3E1EW78_9FLAO|nr:3-deoxy-7-phosphoheptulonate synthase [Brumimicrobium aurantiacum]RFC53810.1 3-deoxy-7-phosphoheptulonate synthase [Brumimicrobium aurantiacum]
MILKLNTSISQAEAAKIAEEIKAFHISYQGSEHLITSSSLKEVPEELKSKVDQNWVFQNDMQLASREFQAKTREIKIGDLTIGGDTNNTILIGGPCSVESLEQIQESAGLIKSLGLTTLRGGCYKPRTSPYSFQGLGLEGLKLLAKMREEHGLSVITEVRDATHVQDVIEHSDIIQIGAKAMYDQGILRACAKIKKPVLLKRGFGTTLQEFVQAAEFILSGGNDQVILCERGIRTFETKTRFTLDLCGVAYLQEHTNLPIILDPSHALGYRYGIEKLAKACVAMGIDGLLIEAHPDPSVAKSDAAQQLSHDQFKALKSAIEPVANSVGYKIV